MAIIAQQSDTDNLTESDLRTLLLPNHLEDENARLRQLLEETEKVVTNLYTQACHWRRAFSEEHARNVLLDKANRELRRRCAMYQVPLG